MKQVNKAVISFCILFIVSSLFIDSAVGAAEKNKEEQKEAKKESFSLPKNVMSISKTNTFPNTPEDLEVIEPSQGDRKSTRLNSSHVAISYAVFCLKKKNKKEKTDKHKKTT